MRRLTIFIAISIMIHLALKLGLFELADIYLAQHKPVSLYEIELQPEPQKNDLNEKQRPLVKQLANQEQIRPDDKTQARFDSEKTQRVAKETQARSLGLTRNQIANKPKNLENENRFKPKTLTKNQTHQQETDFNQTQSLPEFTQITPQQYFKRSQESGESTISQLLPSDIQFSDATNLNTDANTYYSFYSRVEELFYVRWSERLHYYWDRLSFEFKKNQLAGQIWSTTIEVLLNANGEYKSSIIHKSSGYKPFDEAAVFAFKDSAFFPNPPKEKIDPDGFIHLKYRLSVHVGNM